MSTKQASQTERNALAKHASSQRPHNIDDYKDEEKELDNSTSPDLENKEEKVSEPAAKKEEPVKETSAKPKSSSTAKKTTTKPKTEEVKEETSTEEKPKATSSAAKSTTAKPKTSTTIKSTTAKPKTSTTTKSATTESKEAPKKTSTKSTKVETQMPANRSAVVIKKSDIIKNSSVAKKAKAVEAQPEPKVDDSEKERLMREKIKEELRKELMEELKAKEEKPVKPKKEVKEEINLPPIKSNEQILRERLLQEQILSEQARREQIIQETINSKRLANEQIETKEKKKVQKKEADNDEYKSIFDQKEEPKKEVKSKQDNDSSESYSSFFTTENKPKEEETNFEYYGEFIPEEAPKEEPKQDEVIEEKVEKPRLRLDVEIERAQINKVKLKDDAIISALKIDKTNNDEKDLLDYCNDKGLLARTKVAGYFITLAYNKKTTITYEDITSVLGQYIIIVANYQAIRIDLANHNSRSIRTYLKNIKVLDKKSIFLELGKVFIANKIYSIEEEKNISHLTTKFNSMYKKNYKHLSNLEINEFIMLLFDCHCAKGTLNNDIYQSLYKKNIEKLAPETCEYCLCVLANCYLRNGDFKKARKTYEEALIYNPNNFECITHVILMRYKCRTFEELYKKRSFSKLHEFKELLEKAKRENNEELEEKYHELEKEAKEIETKIKYKALGTYRIILMVLGILGAAALFIASYVTNHTKAWEWYYYAICAAMIVGSGFITNNFKKAIIGIIIRILIAAMILTLWYYLGNVLGFIKEVFTKLNILPQFESKTNYFKPREPLF